MKTGPMEHTGDSSNIAYYAERGQPDGYTWAEVCRNDFHWPGGTMTRRRVPTFRFTVYKAGTGEIMSFLYEPRTRPAAGPLSPRTVTRLIRDKAVPS